MTKLSVNINKLATLRNARGKNNPDLVKSALELLGYGAEGITIHPRPDERHVRRSDVFELRDALKGKTELNIEGYPSEDFLKMVEEICPAQCTLVPDPPEALTSNAGWLVSQNQSLLSEVAQRLKKRGVRSSFFVDPRTTSKKEFELLASMGVDRVELYTERFAETHGTADGPKILREYKEASETARALKIGVNAGHDLSLENLTALVRAIPWIDEVSIGHALVCDALTLGFPETIRRYLECIRDGQKG